MFTPATVSAIRHLSEEIASDALEGFSQEEFGCTEEELLAEMVMDASRLTMAGYPEADAEIRSFVTARGYDDVLGEVARHVRY